MMNKDLPIIIQKVFTNPDPIIWRGVWMITLKLLLNNKKMVKVWAKLLSIIKSNHKLYPNLQLNQYIKWELKAFVAQVVKLRMNNVDMNQFSDGIKVYFSRKNIIIEEQFIKEIYNSTNEN